VLHQEPAGPTEYSSKTIELDKSQRLRVTLRMGAGDLRVTDSSQNLLRGDFEYNVAEWKPEVQYKSEGETGILNIQQPGHTHNYVGSTRYRWDLQLTNKVPMDLTVHFGAGQARMDLGSMMLRSVEINMGVGQLDMDLRGAVKHSYNVTIHGGVGQATVRLPATAAIYAEAHGGIGAVNVTGLHNRGGHWESDAWAGAQNRINVEVHGGIGEIRLIAD